MEKNFELAKDLSIPILDELESFRFVQEKITRVPYEMVKEKKALPIDETKEAIQVAICDPLNLKALHDLTFFFNKKIEPYLCHSTLLEKAIQRCYQKIENQPSTVTTKEEYDIDAESSDSPLIEFLNRIFAEAIEQKASDIHFEPQEKELLIRYRIDGILQTRHAPSKHMQAELIARIKVLAKLDIAEQRLPQDGRIKVLMKGKDIDFRVSTIPTIFGERVVLRILDKSNVLFGLDYIQMREDLLATFKKWIQYPEGIILVTGPTGSGKTTTLYSAILELNTKDKNIMTIEDPVEYKLQNIAQINVNPKIDLTFSSGLRHILRQDPDTIFIGEIRDKETAEIAIQASLTGHLVFSTLHTNDAPSALTRLSEMGIEKYLLSSSVIGILAQRLVRKICINCRTSYFPKQEELDELQVSFEVPIRFFRGQGCRECYQTGYLGRCALYELMSVDSHIKSKILTNVDAQSLRKAISIQTLRQYGIDLIKKGMTTSSEILRVTRFNEEL